MDKRNIPSIALMILGFATFLLILFKEPSSTLFKVGTLVALVLLWGAIFFSNRQKMVGSGLKGSIYIFLGLLLIFLAASAFIIRATAVIIGLYLIYSGLKLRNDQQILFYVHRFRDRF